MGSLIEKTIATSLAISSMCAFAFEVNAKSVYYPPVHGSYTCDDSPKIRIKLQQISQSDAYIVFSTGPVKNYRLDKNLRYNGRGVKFSDRKWSFIINGNTARVSSPWGNDVCDED